MIAIQLNTGGEVSRLSEMVPSFSSNPQKGNTRSLPAVTSYDFFIMKLMSRRKKGKGPIMMYYGPVSTSPESYCVAPIGF